MPFSEGCLSSGLLQHDLPVERLSMADRAHRGDRTWRRGCAGGAFGCLVGALGPFIVLASMSPGEQAQGMVLVIPAAAIGLLVGAFFALADGDEQSDEPDGACSSTDGGGDAVD